MNRGFKFLVDKYNSDGARSEFEKICWNLTNCLYGSSYQIKVQQGDGGIDVFVGNFNSQVMVFQCKFFIDGIGDSQKGQIRESFKKCFETLGGSLSTWVLCVPVVLTLDNQIWWSKWSEEKRIKHGINIELWDENKIMFELKNTNLYDQYFDTVRVDKSFVDNLIDSDKKAKVNEDFRWIINYICNNDFIYNDINALADIYELSEKYRADEIFYNSSLINLLESLSGIVERNAQDGVIRNEEAKQQINALRQAIVDEYKKLMFWN
jgi:hypothetical protein